MKVYVCESPKSNSINVLGYQKFAIASSLEKAAEFCRKYNHSDNEYQYSLKRIDEGADYFYVIIDEHVVLEGEHNNIYFKVYEVEMDKEFVDEF